MTESEARTQWLADFAEVRKALEANDGLTRAVVLVGDSSTDVLHIRGNGMSAQAAFLRAAEIVRRRVGPLPGPDVLGEAVVLIAQTAFAVGALGAIPGALPALREALSKADLDPEGARVLIDEIAAALVSKNSSGSRLTWLGKQVARLGLRAFLGGVKMDQVKAWLNRYAPLLSGVELGLVALLNALGYSAAAKTVELIGTFGGLGVGLVNPELAAAISPFILAGVTFYGTSRKLYSIATKK